MGKVRGHKKLGGGGRGGKKPRDRKNMGVGKKQTVKKEKQKHTWKSVREKKNSKSADVQEVLLPEEHESERILPTSSSHSQPTSSSLRNRMLERLSIARFRTLNADIDSTGPSISSENPLASKETFKSYHTGFSTASSLWKQNPVELISEWVIKVVPKNHVIADFGCGTGSLAKLIPQQTYSFDLHALEDHVTECDMRDVPLGDGTVHVVVFCLSLMGLDVTEFLVEARRVLVPGGRVKIVEAAARLQGNHMRTFVGGMKDIGFQKVGGVQEIGGGDGNTHVFVIIEFKKIDVKSGGKGKKKVLLGPCVYKKR